MKKKNNDKIFESFKLVTAGKVQNSLYEKFKLWPVVTSVKDKTKKKSNCRFLLILLRILKQYLIFYSKKFLNLVTAI
jgi:hypothetical protein